MHGDINFWHVLIGFIALALTMMSLWPKKPSRGSVSPHVVFEHEEAARASATKKFLDENPPFDSSKRS
jgi:hypothetical protein